MNENLIRMFDVLISSFFLIILSPLFVFIGLIILLFNGRPIIFEQRRVGLYGKQFRILKFRTMNKNLNFDSDIERLTNFGKILRRLSLDELPQLINVIKKEMSIVGPRPLPKSIESKIPYKYIKQRRKILPGITGFSQINYSGKTRKLNDKVKLDILFVNNYTIQNYFKIIMKTPLIVLRRLVKNKSTIIG